MICNPVVKQSSGSQVYSITDNAHLGFPASAEAGERVEVYSARSPFDIVLQDSLGRSIPYNKSDFDMTAMLTVFIMPASDVTTSTVDIVIG